MALEFNEKIYRNLQEQVLKNKDDIYDILHNQSLLATVGIHFVGLLNSLDDLPDASTYQGEFGDAYFVGDETPRDLYLYTESNVAKGMWLNVGPFPAVGPQGETGLKGDKGPQGNRGSSWSAGQDVPYDTTGRFEGDVYLQSSNGDVYMVVNAKWQLVTNIIGPVGPIGQRGLKGEKGDIGPTGPVGPKGDNAFVVTIRAKLATIDELPNVLTADRHDAYVVTATDPYSIYGVVENKSGNLEWAIIGTTTFYSISAQEVTYDGTLASRNVGAAIEELNSIKLDTDALEWTTLDDVADKNKFYQKVIRELRTAKNKIYMWEAPGNEPIKKFFELWGKPQGFLASHVYVVIESISNKASRDSFSMTIHSSNYANVAYMVVNGYASQLLGSSGWISYNEINQDAIKHKADIDGTFEKLVSGDTLGIIDPREEPSIDGSFITRKTAGGEAIKEDVKTALVRVFGGNTLVLNNQFSNTDFVFGGRVTTNNGVTYTINPNGSIKIKGLAAQGAYVALFSIDLVGHKVLLRNDTPEFQIRFIAQNGREIYNGIETLGNAYITCKQEQGVNYNIEEAKIELIDLTQMFGAGKEPKNLEEALLMGVPSDYVPYNIGSLINSKFTNLKSFDTSGELIDTLRLNSATYFPNGLNGVNNVHDTISKGKYTKRFGIIDLGTLNWSEGSSSLGRTNSKVLEDIKLPQDYTQKGNDLCSSIEYVSYETLNAEKDKVIAIHPNNRLYLQDKTFANKTSEEIKIALSGVMFVYELATPEIITIKDPLDFTYKVDNGGTETFDSKTPVYTEIEYKENLVMKLALGPSHIQYEEQNRRITALEGDSQHYSSDIHDLIDNKADKTQLEGYMNRYHYRGNVYEIDLYNQLLAVDNIAHGAMFSVEIETTTPSEAVGRGFPVLEAQATVYGWFTKDELGDIMMIMTSKGLFKIIDGGTLTCERV